MTTDTLRIALQNKQDLVLPVIFTRSMGILRKVRAVAMIAGVKEEELAALLPKKENSELIDATPSINLIKTLVQTRVQSSPRRMAPKAKPEYRPIKLDFDLYKFSENLTSELQSAMSSLKKKH
jgi:hypothetical protein